MNKLYVGGLAWATDDQALREAFESFGEVLEAKVVTDRETGRSRGFGFVTYAQDEDAQRAVELDGSTLQGRTIRVSIARPKEGGPRRGNGGPGGGGGPRKFDNGGRNRRF